jgi:hypothetical protein
MTGRCRAAPVGWSGGCQLGSNRRSRTSDLVDGDRFPDDRNRRFIDDGGWVISAGPIFAGGNGADYERRASKTHRPEHGELRALWNWCQSADHAPVNYDDSLLDELSLSQYCVPL